MRLRVDVDKLERGLTYFTDQWPDLRFSWRSRLMFPPGQTPRTDTVGMKAVLRRASIFPFLILACFAAFFIFTSFIAVAMIAIEYRHYIHHVNWQLIKLLCGIAYKIQLKVIYKDGGSPIDYVFIILGFAVVNFIFLLTLRWAWNRRANRLIREASLPQPAFAIDTDIWPPPPNVLEGQ